MAGFDHDEAFSPILKKIKLGDIRTAYQLRLLLEGLSDQHKVTTLNMLLLFREWLLQSGLDLSTEHGGVVLQKVDDPKR